MPSKSPPPMPIRVNPLFNWLIIINSLLCLISLAVMIWAVSDPSDPMPKGKERLFSACEHVFTLTAGAFIGLLGGRAAAPDSLPSSSP